MKNDLFLGESKAGSGGILSHLGILGSAATVTVFSVLFFADISLDVKGAVNFSVGFLLLFFSSYLMYFSLFEAGKDKGERTAEHEALKKEREALFARYTREGETEGLFAFCRALSLREQREARRLCLSAYFLTEEEARLLEEKPFRTLSFRERRAVRALRRAKCVSISPKALLSDRESYRYRPPLSASPDLLRAKRCLVFLIPAALTAAFSVAVVCEIISSPTAGDVAGYLFKLFTLLHSGIKGYRAGYEHMTADRAAYMKEQCALLSEYFQSTDIRA